MILRKIASPKNVVFGSLRRLRRRAALSGDDRSISKFDFEMAS
jgi:hypothetical protein